jgi:hypothetical protein
LHAQVSALAVTSTGEAEDVDVQELVARAVEDSERRLTDHIDQAVLALAEALLRRRGSRPTGRLEAAPAVIAPAAEETPDNDVDDAAEDDDVDDFDDTEEVVDDSEDGEEAVAADDEDDTEEEFEEAEDVPDLDDERPAGPARWQTPVTPSAATPPEPPPVAKRKPWWRPGD